MQEETDGPQRVGWGERRRHQGHTLGFLAQSPPILREADGRVCTELSATTRRAGRGPGALPRARAWKPRFTGGSHLRPLAEQRRRGLAGARRPSPPRVKALRGARRSRRTAPPQRPGRRHAMEDCHGRGRLLVKTWCRR